MLVSRRLLYFCVAMYCNVVLHDCTLETQYVAVQKIIALSQVTFSSQCNFVVVTGEEYDDDYYEYNVHDDGFEEKHGIWQ